MIKDILTCPHPSSCLMKPKHSSLLQVRYFKELARIILPFMMWPLSDFSFTAGFSTQGYTFLLTLMYLKLIVYYPINASPQNIRP